MSVMVPIMALQPSAYGTELPGIMQQNNSRANGYKSPLDLLLETKVAFVDAKHPDDALAQINLEPINPPRKIDINTEGVRPLNGQLPQEIREIVASWPPGFTKPGSGFYNVGNTCYLNATLQALVHMPSFVSALVVDKMHQRAQCHLNDRNKYCALCAMSSLMSSSLFRTSAITPEGFTNFLSRFAPGLRVGRQEDAHEFLRFVVDAMQNSCLAGFSPARLKAEPALQQKTLIFQLFGGKVRSRVTCFACRAVSDTFEDMLDLSLPLEESMDHLSQSFDAFVKTDSLQGANKYKCEKCKALANASKQLTLHQAPNILTIHLKRFTPMGRKLNVQIKYQEFIRVDPYMSDDSEQVWYRLDGIISHSGYGPSSGHYFSHIRAADKRWYRMDDSSVSYISSGVNSLLSMKTAYILMYTRIDPSTAPVTEEEPERMQTDPSPFSISPFFGSRKSDAGSTKRKDSNEPEDSPVDSKRARQESDPMPFAPSRDPSRPPSSAGETNLMPGSFINGPSPAPAFYGKPSGRTIKTYSKKDRSNGKSNSSSSDGEFRPGSSGSSSSNTTSAASTASSRQSLTERLDVRFEKF